MHIAVITICVLTEEEVSFMEERLLHIGQTDSVCLYDLLCCCLPLKMSALTVALNCGLHTISCFLLLGVSFLRF